MVLRKRRMQEIHKHLLKKFFKRSSLQNLLFEMSADELLQIESGTEFHIP